MGVSNFTQRNYLKRPESESYQARVLPESVQNDLSQTFNVLISNKHEKE